MTAPLPLILLVEDDENDEELARLALEAAGVPHAVAVTRDGVEALARLEDFALPLPDLVLLDLKLPKLGGLAVLRATRAMPELAGLPIVVFTSSLEPRDLAECSALHANGYVCKPVDFDAYAEAVRDTVRFWLLRHQHVVRSAARSARPS